MDENLLVVTIWSGFLILVTLFGTSLLLDRTYKLEAIERGYAQYCPNNGEWAWKGECKD